MGWMCSWVAVKADKAGVLDALGFVETGEECDPGSGSAPFCVAERAGGWTIVFSDDFDWMDPARVVELSRNGLAVGCAFEDKVEMTSVACAAEAGVELWRVFHNSDPILHLDVTGAPPPEFAAIRDRYFADQEAEGGEGADCDYVHEVPLELAKAVCGYRADEDDEPFFVLRSARAASASAQARDESPRRSWLSRLFGR